MSIYGNIGSLISENRLEALDIIDKYKAESGDITDEM